MLRKTLHSVLCLLLWLLWSSCSSENLTFNADDIVLESDLVLSQDQLVFVHISDVHRSNVSLSPALYYLNQTPSSFGILTGDVVATDAMLREIGQSVKPMLLIPGNHDAYKGHDVHAVGQYGFRNQVLNEIGQDEKVVFGSERNNYWYQDFHRGGYTLRVIGIDQFEFESVNANFNSKICLYSQSQIDWLINLLENSGSCDGIIIVIHCGFGNESVWSRDKNVSNDFITIYAKDIDWLYEYYGNRNIKIIPDIINAYQTGVNLTEQKYGNSDSGDKLTVTTHFKGSHDNFIAYMGGHAHCDIVEHLTPYPRQLQVLIAYCGDGTGTSSPCNDLIKGTNDRNSYNFNVNIIDFKKRQLKIIRKGANVKVDGTTRDSIVFNY